MRLGDSSHLLFGPEFEERVDQSRIQLLCPARKGENPRAEAQFFIPLRQILESIKYSLMTNSIWNNSGSPPG